MNNLRIRTAAGAAPVAASGSSAADATSPDSSPRGGDVCSRFAQWVGALIQGRPGRDSARSSNTRDLGSASTRGASLSQGMTSVVEGAQKMVQLKGTALISKKAFLDFDNSYSSIVDSKYDVILQQKVDLQLVSLDLDKDGKIKLSETSSIQEWTTSDRSSTAGQETYKVNFRVPEDFGEVGAFVIRNNHANEFYLQSLTLQLPNKSEVDFICQSWIYPEEIYNNKSLSDRVFFSTKTYLPSETPAALKAFREQELKDLRGNGQGSRKVYDRIYDYDVYNDLANPDDGIRRPVLGGRGKLPYPRRCRTGRGPTKKDKESEKRIAFISILSDFYVPSDEHFGAAKTSNFLASALKGVSHNILPLLQDHFSCDKTPYFDTLNDIHKLYSKGVNLKSSIRKENESDSSKPKNPLVFLKTIFDDDGQNQSVLGFPVPQIIAVNDMAWMSDEEFGRQTLSGLNPMVIELVKEFPPRSSLDSAIYGEPTALTHKHIEPYLKGLSVPKAIDSKRLFTIDYHDAFLPYINRINNQKNTEMTKKAYAPRAFFFLTNEGTLKPVAIELSLPPPSPGSKASNRVFTPPTADGQVNILWNLAKVHFNSIDFGYHELISHWLRTHCVMEPFIIASRRQLSAMHPVFQLLYPIFRNTMTINAAARFALINAGGVIEDNFAPGEYSMEMSAAVYGATWRFDEQALPRDLVARGMAEPADRSYPGGVKLVVDDYPFAKDGLEVWDALYNWITDYVTIVYKGSDDAVKSDNELQEWWREVIHVGHADKADAPGWPELDSTRNLVDILCTLHWIAGPHHAAVNFGQYGYAGFMPNKPSVCVRLIPEEGTPAYNELLRSDPILYLLTMVSPQSVATSVMTTLELLSTHAQDEEYIGQRGETWTADERVKAAYRKFSQQIKEVEKHFEERNSDSKHRNRNGPADLAYTLMYPTSVSGITGRGIPNSISI